MNFSTRIVLLIGFPMCHKSDTCSIKTSLRRSVWHKSSNTYVCMSFGMIPSPRMIIYKYFLGAPPRLFLYTM